MQGAEGPAGPSAGHAHGSRGDSGGSVDPCCCAVSAAIKAVQHSAVCLSCSRTVQQCGTAELQSLLLFLKQMDKDANVRSKVLEEEVKRREEEKNEDKVEKIDKDKIEEKMEIQKEVEDQKKKEEGEVREEYIKMMMDEGVQAEEMMGRLKEMKEKEISRPIHAQPGAGRGPVYVFSATCHACSSCIHGSGDGEHGEGKESSCDMDSHGGPVSSWQVELLSEPAEPLCEPMKQSHSVRASRGQFPEFNQPFQVRSDCWQIEHLGLRPDWGVRAELARGGWTGGICDS